MGITDAKIVNFFNVSTKKRKIVNFLEFERIVSQKRLSRYVNASGGDTRKALTLYRYNLRISQEMFTMISCFEVAFRNAIDNELSALYGNEWLKDSISTGGFLTGSDTIKSFGIVKHTYDKLVSEGQYSHTKLLSGLEFGVWKYMFSPPQYRATGRVLLRVSRINSVLLRIFISTIHISSTNWTKSILYGIGLPTMSQYAFCRGETWCTPIILKRNI